MNKEQLITLDFLRSRVGQTQKDLEMYSLMLQELEELLAKASKSETKAKFLSVVSNVSGHEKTT